MSRLTEQEAQAFVRLSRNDDFRLILDRWSTRAEQEQLALQNAPKKTMQVSQGRCQVYTEIFSEVTHAEAAAQKFKEADEQPTGLTV